MSADVQLEMTLLGFVCILKKITLLKHKNYTILLKITLKHIFLTMTEGVEVKLLTTTIIILGDVSKQEQ